MLLANQPGHQQKDSMSKSPSGLINVTWHDTVWLDQFAGQYVTFCVVALFYLGLAAFLLTATLLYWKCHAAMLKYLLNNVVWWNRVLKSLHQLPIATSGWSLHSRTTRLKHVSTFHHVGTLETIQYPLEIKLFDVFLATLLAVEYHMHSWFFMFFLWCASMVITSVQWREIDTSEELILERLSTGQRALRKIRWCPGLWGAESGWRKSTKWCDKNGLSICASLHKYIILSS